MADERILSGWTVQMKPENKTPEEEAQTLFFELNIDDRGVISGSVFNAKDDGVPEDAPFSQVTGRRQPSDSPDGSLMSLSFTSGALNFFLSGFTFFNDPFTHFEGRYRVTPREGLAPADVNALESAVAAGPGDTGTGTGQQT